MVRSLAADGWSCHIALPAPSPMTDEFVAAGATLHVQMSYDMSNLLILPSTFHLGWMSVTLPTALPSYTMYVMAE